MKDVYSCLVECQNKSNEELIKDFDEYRDKFDNVLQDYFKDYIKGCTYEYRGLTVKHMILNHKDLFYRGLYSFMELKNRKEIETSNHQYFNTEILTSSLALFYLYPSSYEVKISEEKYEKDDTVDKEFILGLLNIELCNYILFDNDFIPIMNRIKFLDGVVNTPFSIFPILAEHLNNQSLIGKQLMMEYRLKN